MGEVGKRGDGGAGEGAGFTSTNMAAAARSGGLKEGIKSDGERKSQQNKATVLQLARQSSGGATFNEMGQMLLLLRSCYVGERVRARRRPLRGAQARCRAQPSSSIMLLSGGRPTHARITFSSIARCLASALTTGAPEGTIGALVR